MKTSDEDLKVGDQEEGKTDFIRVPDGESQVSQRSIENLINWTFFFLVLSFT